MKNDVYIPIEFEHFLSELFGQTSHHGSVGIHSLSDWKKELIKIIRTIRRAIKINIDTDDFHRDDMVRRCDLAIENIKKSTTGDEVNSTMISFSVRLNFMLMGDLPNNWDKKSISHNSSLTLNSCRNIAYMKNNEQKANLIMSLPNKWDYRDRVPNHLELWLKRFREFNGDTEKFLNWFKLNYTEVYLELT